MGAGIRQVREMPLSVQAGHYYNIEKPEGAADSVLRLQLRLLFPVDRPRRAGRVHRRRAGECGQF